MNSKQIWLLAGGNGAGKSTFYHTQLEPLGLPFVNADILAKQLYPESPEQHSYDAAIIAEQIRKDLLEQGNSFCFETVFSHPSKIDFVAHAKTLDYEIILVFIHLDSVSLNHSRIHQRITEGGHSVPAEKVETRIPRTLKNIRTVVPLCNFVYILDNSRLDNPFNKLVTISNGKIIKESVLPPWCKLILSEFDC